MVRVTALQLLLGLLACYHLGMGAVSLTSHRGTARIARGLYGLELDASPQMAYAVKMLGLYALTVGALLAAAAADPPAHRVVIGAVIGLQSMRAICRGVFRDSLTRGFGVTPRRNLANLILLLAQVVALVWLFPPRGGA